MNEILKKRSGWLPVTIYMVVWLFCVGWFWLGTNDDSFRKMLYLASKKLSNTGLPGVEIGTWFWPSSSSCFKTARLLEPGLILVFPGRETAFTLRVHTVSHPGTWVRKPG